MFLPALLALPVTAVLQGCCCCCNGCPGGGSDWGDDWSDEFSEALADEEERPRWQSALVASLQRRRDLISERLAPVFGGSLYRPEGAFYVFPNLGGLVTLQDQIGHCWEIHLDRFPLQYDDPDLVALETYVRNRARGQVIHVRTDGPLATVQKARDVVREAKAGGLARPVTVMLRGGVYPQTEPIVFTAADSARTRSPTARRAA